jgi:hypothetical protein
MVLIKNQLGWVGVISPSTLWTRRHEIFVFLKDGIVKAHIINRGVKK